MATDSPTMPTDLLDLARLKQLGPHVPSAHQREQDRIAARDERRRDNDRCTRCAKKQYDCRCASSR